MPPPLPLTPHIPIHQTYILPAPPFRRRQSSILSASTTPGSSNLSNTYFPLSPSSPLSTTSTTPGTSYSTTPSIISPLSPPLLYQNQNQFEKQSLSQQQQTQRRGQRRPSYLSGHTAHISCAKCKASLALTSQIISKGFTGRYGRAYLVSPSLAAGSGVPIDATKEKVALGRASSRVSVSAPTANSNANENTRMAGNASAVAAAAPITRRRSSALATVMAYTFSFGSSSSSSSSSSATANTSTSPFSALSTALSSTISRTSNPKADADFLPNTTLGPATQRHLVTGLHTVCDMTCLLCNSTLGWKYLHAEEASQKYKEGMYILETGRVIVGVEWQDDDDDDEDEDEELELDDYEDLLGWDRGAGGRGRNHGRMQRGGVGKDKGKARDPDSHPEPESTADITARSRTPLQSPSLHTPSRTQQSQKAKAKATRRRRYSHTPIIFGMDDEHHHSTTTNDHTNNSPNDQYDSNNSTTDDTDDTDEDEADAGEQDEEGKEAEEESDNNEILFDSQDEEECEDLFAGVWNAEVVRARRMSRK